jgi:galactonate dehydratase
VVPRRRTPEEFHAATRRVIERGYHALKLDPFGAGWYELTASELRLSLSLVEAVRDAIGPDTELFVEMHGRFTPRQAITIARELERVAPGWIEEPVPPRTHTRWAKVARAVNVPVATGERIHVRHEFREILELEAADILQPDLTHCGGMLEAKRSPPGQSRTTCLSPRITSAARWPLPPRSTSPPRHRISRSKSTSTTSSIPT